MNHFIAIDGGGTKTEAILTDNGGHIYARSVGGPSNPNDTSVDDAADTIAALVNRVTADLPDQAGCVLSAGIAGALNHRNELEAAIRVRLPEIAEVQVVSDVQILLSSELPTGDGACVICGTGSACFLRRGDEIVRIGGWGYLLDSGGSGYDIGRDALEAALREHDGRGQATSLTQLLTAKLGAQPHESLTAIYIGGKPLIASCAPVVFEAAKIGDAVAQGILARNARALAECIEAAYRQVGSGEALRRFEVVMGGGINQHCSEWVVRVAALVDDSVPLCIKVATAPPVLGAVFRAAQMAAAKQYQLAPDFDALRAAFARTYERYL